MGGQDRGRWGGWMDPESTTHPRTHLPRARPQALTCSYPQDSNSCVSMPTYFRFLTLMAFHIFLQEKVRTHFPEPCA